MYFHRAIEPMLLEATKQFPAVVVTGARQVGKSTLLQNCFSHYTYTTLDDPFLRSLANNDPELFLQRFKTPLIIDEIQHASNLFHYIKMKIDQNRTKLGQYILTGSQSFSLMSGLTETLAGRVGVFHLYPLSLNETDIPETAQGLAEQILKGFYPEFRLNQNLDPHLWYASYLTTYVERDVRQMIKVADLNRFQLFISLLATRAGQLLNVAEIAKECAITSPTAQAWLSILESSYVVYLLKPYFKNVSKRLVKSKKLYFVDTGLLCYLLGIDTPERFLKASERGHIFENMVVMEAVKRIHQQARPIKPYYFRTSLGLEADLLLEQGNEIEGYEIKFSSTLSVHMADNLTKIHEKVLPLHLSRVINLHKVQVPLNSKVDSIYFGEAFSHIVT